MSANEGELADLKGGHAPATKVGGMRVVQHKKDGDKTEPAPMTAEEKEEYVEDVPKEKPGHGLVVSGAVTKVEKGKEAMLPKTLVENPDILALFENSKSKGDKDFTPQAVKSYHEKPKPVHDNRPRAPQVTGPIHQPR